MCLRALCSLLTRRFSPRAQAQAPATGTQAAGGSAAGRSTRFLHSWRSLAVGGAVVASAASSGGLAFLYLKKDTDESACKVIGDQKAGKEVTDMKPGKIISDEACDDRKAGHEATGSEPLKDQRDMKAEFEDWMKKYNKTYFDEEEKAMRFQLFKARVEFIDSHHSSSARKKGFPKLSFFADLTPQERGRLRGVSPPDEEFYEFLKSPPEFINYHKGVPGKA